MKKPTTELSTSMYSAISRRAIRAETTPQVASNSLQRQIAKIKESERVSYIGISSVSECKRKSKVPKQQSYFDSKLQCSHNRIKNPSQEPKMRNHAPQTFMVLSQYCKSQRALELGAKKYQVKKGYMSGVLNGFNMPKMMDKINQKILRRPEITIKNVIKDEVLKRIPTKKKNINYEMDSLFHNYKGLTQQFNKNKEEKEYNVYTRIYTDSQKESIYLPSKEREHSISDESIAYQDFLEQVDEAEIQRDVYNTNIRNPFLDDKITVKTMKKAGMLKRRFVAQI